MKRNNEEQKLHIAAVQYIKWSLPNVLFFHSPNGGARNEIEASLLKKMGVLPGVPDLLFFWDNKKAGLELKSLSGTQSKPQREFELKWRNLGGLYRVCRSLAEIEDAVISWGLQPKYRVPRSVINAGKQMKQQFVYNMFKPLEEVLPKICASTITTR